MFCRKCGKEIDSSSNFCEFCGTSLSAEQEVTNSVSVKHSSLEVTKSQSFDSKFKPASQGKRFLNFIIDIFGYLAFCYLSGITLGMFGLAYLLENTQESILSGILLISYYLIFEGIWGKTPAKYLTKTKVITKEGYKPDFGTILVRTLCRYIPFDNFSFLSSNPVGWHDSISKTLVVDERGL